MKRILPALAAAMLALGTAAVDYAAEDAMPPTVLLTAFGPFAGRGSNGSETVARSLDGQVIAGCQVHVMVMPVKWGQPAKDLPPAVARLHPRLLLGLGEGFPDHVAVEFVGRNLAGGELDEANQRAPSGTLESAGPSQRAATFHFDPMWFPMPPVAIQRSTDAGDYLCNACLYTALGTPVAVCGFVHLPPQGDQSAAQYAPPLASIIRTLIERNLTALP